MSGQTSIRIALVCGVLLWALGLRIWRLDGVLFRVDEAESTINALTILERGYPANEYLGLPVFENTLTEPWPESAEYEFRDSSYSRRGFAIYHGWLPLYSIAASLATFGIEPDRPTPKPEVRHSSEEMARMTRAARAPAVLFGMILLALLFAMGGELHGPDAGWGAFLAAAFTPWVIDVARQARYYSLSALLSTACCLWLWKVYRRGRWRDFVLCALVLGLLFHTHVLAFVTGCAMFCLLAPFLIRRPGFLARGATLVAIVLLLTLPWIWLTGFLEQAASIPKAWPLLELPTDLFAFIRFRLAVSSLLLGGSALFLVTELVRHRLPERVVRPFAARREEFWYLIVWLTLAYVAFTRLSPAVSYSLDRLALPMLGPGLVLAAGLLGALARVARTTLPPALTGLLLPAYLAVCGDFDPLRLEHARPIDKQETIEYLRRFPFTPDTRIFSTPNFHLVLSVYTGLPVQSVAPVRKSFLDSYPGDVVVVEVFPFRFVTPEVVREAAKASGMALDPEQAREQAWLVTTSAVRERLAGQVACLDPPLCADLAPYLRRLCDDQPRYTQQRMANESSIKAFPAVFRGFPVRDWSDWWSVYFYRFVEPATRTGDRLNYRERVRSGQASVLSSGVTIYQSPGADARSGPCPGGGT